VIRAVESKGKRIRRKGAEGEGTSLLGGQRNTTGVRPATGGVFSRWDVVGLTSRPSSQKDVGILYNGKGRSSTGEGI